ncbi:MAG: hypothetical protein J6M44_07910 [Butyrivibrio sp.]|nr:hypothetical protein [Butyrivibrio sp.]MBP3278864.1 hypothetical protein [Butyrivibrio sp.]
MVTTVKLQAPFEYSWIVTLSTIVLGIITAVILGYVVKKLLDLREKTAAKRPRYHKIRLTPENLAKMKKDYIGRVSVLLNGYLSGKLSKRDGYQKLSGIIRSFVHEVTGINVESFTVKEVKALGIRKLDELMEEYYVPEFAEDEKAENKDFAASCRVAMGVINSWS